MSSSASPVQTAVGVTVVSFVLVACLFDVELNEAGRRVHPRVFRWRRLLNWFPCGVAYAMYYTSRYNVAAGNVPSVQAQLGLGASAFASVMSCGFWTYGASAVFTGRHADALGGRTGFLVGVGGAAACNLLLGFCFLHGLPSAIELPVFATLYSLNILLQGYGTSGIVKVNAAWYSPEERGVFSGVFNVMLTSGYFFALGLSGEVISKLGWSFMFFIPGGVLAVFFVVIWLTLAQQPKDASWGVSHLHSQQRCSVVWTSGGDVELPALPPHTEVSALNGGAAASAPATALPAPAAEESTSSLFAQLMRDSVFLCYLGALFALCWVRDGSINWYLAYFDEVQPGHIDSDTTALVGGAITVGGFVGGMLCGWLSDMVFGGSRVKPMVLFSALNLAALAALHKFAPSASPVATGALVFVNMLLVLGNYTLLSYAIPQDLPSPVVATATGVMTAVSYMASGLSGSGMHTVIQWGGFAGWYRALMLGLVLQLALLALSGYCGRNRPRVEQAPRPPANANKYRYTTVTNTGD